MPVYKTGEKSRNKIIDACKELFYLNGFKKTTYKDICEKASSNPGLINYYFKTKKKIGEIIYGNFYVEIKAGVEDFLIENYGEYDLQVGTCIEILVINALLKRDENLERFYYDMCIEGVEYDMKILKYFYRLHVDRYKLPLTEEQIRLIWVANTSIGIGIAKKYIEGYLHSDEKELYEFRVRLMYNSMGIEKDKIDDIIKRAYEIFEHVGVSLEDYFVIKIFKKD
ncbi:TetR/AcrR family transcriptional regulator [Alkalibacter mobilis]|uniref:TetR/AcrR family transcriptional regulator n=1 Tax=Alkalibacter mobilis TaxID=2787712 RepID=UPI00189EE85E|nr:TetR/AcrR family transcriptional regulator [Alkalibacter mobilis]MBF7095913.1 TetR/AcrR family transcriptional regulator [Alkalibacter mobilis]